MNKKGLSDVITTVLIILLVLAAVVILWSFIRPALERGAKQITSDCLTVNIEPISCTQVTSLNPQIYSVVVKRNPGQGQITGMKFVFDEGERVVDYANSTLILQNAGVLPQILETKTYNITKSTSIHTSLRVTPVVGEGNICNPSAVKVNCN